MTQIMKSKVVRLIIGIVGMICLFQTLSVTAEEEQAFVAVTNSFFSVWICIFSAILYDKVWQKIEIEKSVWGIIYSIALAIALSAGKYLETEENVTITNPGLWINIIILSIYFIPFVLYAWKWLEQGWKKWENKTTRKGVKYKEFIGQWLLIFLCWLPVFLAFYPGAFVYDASHEFSQVAENKYTTHHPLLHVLLLGKLVCAGNDYFDSYNIGIAIYTLFQMIILSGVFSYTICYIKEKTKNKYMVWGTLLFYGLFPVIPMYAVCSSKDTLFTAALLVVFIKMLQILDNTEQYLQKKRNVLYFILASTIMMLLRNNGMYAYVVWIPIVIIGGLFIKKKKESLIKIAVIMISAFILFEGGSKILQVYTNADDSAKQEIMTVPIQQMARTYVYSPETYTAEEKELLLQLIPEEGLQRYRACLSDKVKNWFNNDVFNQNKEEYLKLWIKVGVRKPMIYMNAWLMTSYGFWYPDAVINVYGGNTVQTYTYEESSYFGFETEKPGVRESKFPWLEEQYRKMSLELYQQKVPGISMLFSPGFMFWVFMFCFCYLLQKGRWDKGIAYIGILLLWLTTILGPTYLVRYVLILWFALPVIVAETKV